MYPTLNKNCDFNVWKLQFESATKSKIYDKLNGDANHDTALLSNLRLSVLPSVISDEILSGCLERFALGTTTYNTALESVKEHWIRVTRPIDISASLESVAIYSTEDVVPTWNNLKRLKYYTALSDDFIIQKIVSSIKDLSVRQTTQAFCFGKNITPKDLIDFLVTLTFGISTTHPSVNVATNITCFNCNQKGHYSRTCQNQRATCAKCNKRGHLGVFCRSTTQSKNV